MVVLQHAQAVAVRVGLFFAETFAVESEVVHHVRAVRGIVADADSALLYEQVGGVLVQLELASGGPALYPERLIELARSRVGVEQAGTAAEARRKRRTGVLPRLQVLLVAPLDYGLPQHLFVKQEVELQVVGGAFGLQAAVERVGHKVLAALARLLGALPDAHRCHLIIYCYEEYYHASLAPPTLQTDYARKAVQRPGESIKAERWLQQSMNKLVIIALIVPLILAQCWQYCQTCSKNSAPYSCNTCADGTTSYFESCQPPTSASTAPFIAITVIVTLLHLFMLFVGLAVYHDIFQNLQLATLITWRSGFEGGTSVMQAVNLGVASNNSFTDSFGAQFIALVCVLGVFWLLLLMVDRISHNSTAVLVRRKKIILPVRLITLLFNMLVYCSLMQLTSNSFSVLSFVLAVLGLTLALLSLFGIAVASNWKRFDVEDPHYYVLLEEITSKRWYAKNNILFALVVRGVMLVGFASLFRQPQIAGVVMLVAQIAYSLYMIIFIRYTKIRYYVFVVSGNILMIGIVLVSFVAAVSSIGSSIWSQLSSGYVALLVILSALFFAANSIEIVAKKDIITKQLRSFYGRFIICQKSEETVAMTKYDEHSHRERVTEFRTNLLYHKPLAGSRTAELELMPSSNKKTPL